MNGHFTFIEGKQSMVCPAFDMLITVFKFVKYSHRLEGQSLFRRPFEIPTWCRLLEY